MSRAQPGGSRKSTFAIKLSDGEPLTRALIQYDLLRRIFEDDQKVFFCPDNKLDYSRGARCTFHDLYVSTIMASPRSSSVLRDNLHINQSFRTDFAKIALLTNVGRINTTMAFFPEMRTQLRTYHPVPSLQSTEGNLQDAPRIKNILKNCNLPSEKTDGTPNSPTDLIRLQSREGGTVPITSVVNLIFIMANHSLWFGSENISGGSENVDFLSLFLPSKYTSESRARVFLWLCFRYLERAGAENPFDDDFSREHPGKSPALELNPPDVLENVDPPEEVEKGRDLAQKRKEFLAKDKIPVAGKAVEGTGTSTPEPSEKPDRDHAIRPRAKDARMKEPFSNTPLELVPKTASGRRSQKNLNKTLQLDPTHRNLGSDPYPRLHAIQPAPLHGESIRDARTGRSHRRMRHRQSSYEESPSPERSMLEQAFYVVSSRDALADSDEEKDHHARLDYNRRLQILKRLRGRSVTPEPPPSDVKANVNGGRPIRMRP